MLVLGFESDTSRSVIGQYNPVGDAWRASTVETPRRMGPSFVWAGNMLLVWGGWRDVLIDVPGTGYAYDPGTQGTLPITMDNAPTPRPFNSAVWTGSEMLIWGGGEHYPGGRLSPPVFESADGTPPTIVASARKADGTNYSSGTWTNQSVTVHFTCTDALSGVVTCPPDQVFSAEGAHWAFGTATDGAGNQSTAQFGPILIDNTGATVTLHILDHAGDGLAGATASAYYSGSWHSIAGASDANGILTPGAIPKNSGLSIAVVYNGTRLQLNYSQLVSSDFTFQARLVALQLQDHNGAPLDVGGASYYAGSWRSIGNTSGGVATAEMLPGTYSFAMTYNGTRLQLAQDIATDGLVTFRTVQVHLRLQDHTGAPLDTGTGSYYASIWVRVGNTSGGSIPVEMLPGTYSFAMTYLGTRLQLSQNVGTSAEVVFKTGLVHSASGTATSFYAGGWRPYSQDMELLPGTYTFGFSGRPNGSYTLAPGVTNTIY